MMELGDKMRPYFDEVIMKYERGNLVDDETLISICESFIDWYKVHEDVLLRNILEVYRTTNFEKGYSVLTHDWLRVREYCKDREKVDAIEGIRLNVLLQAVNKISCKHIQTVALKSIEGDIWEHDTHHRYFTPIGGRAVIVHDDRSDGFYIFDKISGERLNIHFT